MKKKKFVKKVRPFLQKKQKRKIVTENKIDPDLALVRKTSIERLMESILKENKIDHEMFANVGNFKPDFLLSEKKLIIECDGLYWHSDAHKKDDYHQVKKETYKKEGFDTLFFRENEINDKTKIVESVIKNKLKLISNRIYARKCEIMKLSRKESTQFFDENHLMGRGSGFGYALIYKGDIVCALQAKWKNRNDREMEVSRFCSKLDCSVVGGFSKLLDHAIWLNKPKTLFTFIDGRYGSGEYLRQFGFEKQKTYRSFSWTDGFKTLHRMSFPGNVGYKSGFFKIWDCGQTKWLMDLKKKG
jgi:very-short-patch-repair endonuclease